MENLEEKINKLLSFLGFSNSRIQIDNEHRKISIFVEEGLTQAQIPSVLQALDHLINLFLKREKQPSYVVDLNYYRKERERLILELARAAAHRAVVSKEEVELPPMNAYERRLVHVEITTHPELKTESVGLGKERHVVIKHLN